MRVEVRSVAPDANPYMVLYSIFKTGLDGETAKIKNLRQAERYLPDNIYTAIDEFPRRRLDDQAAGRRCEGPLRRPEAGLGRPLPAAAGNVRQGPRGAIPPRCLQPVPVEPVLDRSLLCDALVFRTRAFFLGPSQSKMKRYWLISTHSQKWNPICAVIARGVT